jgi:hypothetical protein
MANKNFCIVVPTRGTSMFSYWVSCIKDETKTTAWRRESWSTPDFETASTVCAYLNESLGRTDLYVAEWY